MIDLSAEAARWGIEEGYHDVFGQWHQATPETIRRLIAAMSAGGRGPQPEAPGDIEPLRAFQGDGRRVWVLSVQLYALRSRSNWGHGDFGDLARLIGIAAAQGAAGIGLNPMHALFLDRADEASPYAPNSRLFLNPLYIDIEAIPEFPGLDETGLRDTIEALRATDLVDYAGVARAKLIALHAAHKRFRAEATPERRAAFEDFRREKGDDLLRYACFECLRAQYAPKPWREWPQPWRSPDIAQLRAFRAGKTGYGESQAGKTKYSESNDAKSEYAPSRHRKTEYGEPHHGKTEDGEFHRGKTGDGEFHRGKTEDGEFHAGNTEYCEFHEYLQWLAHTQLTACQDKAERLGMSIGLYVDLAVGIDPNGADAWSTQDAVLADVSVGAPPDDLNRDGQNWGLAPFNPHALAAQDFKPMRALLRESMQFAGALRLDHVLGLKRQFLIPHGSSAGEGAYVRFPFEPLLRTTAEESLRDHCIVIGEDLGTVPEGFRETLARWGLWSYRVMLFEREHDGRFRPPEAYPEAALVTFNTHDLPSFHGWLGGHDLRVKRAIGVDPGESDEARAAARAALAAMLSQHGGGEDFAAVAATLTKTPSRLVVVALDDVLGVLDQINVPGTVNEHPNWRRKLPVPIEELEGHEGLLRIARIFAEAGRAILPR